MKTTFKQTIFLLIAAVIVLLGACTPGLTVTQPPAATDLPATQPAATDLPATQPPAATETAAEVAVPPSCRMDGMETYANPRFGYCFVYPAGEFELVEETSGNIIELVGPALDQSAEPVRVRMFVRVSQVGPAANLSRLVDAYLSHSMFQNLPWEVTRTQTPTIGAEPAEVLEDVPGQMSMRVVLTLHAGRLYELIFFPSDLDVAAEGLERLFGVVTSSFAFLDTAEPLPSAAQPSDWVNFGHRIQMEYDSSLVLWPDLELVPAVPLSPDRMFADSLPSQFRVRFLGYNGGALYQLPYPLAHPQIAFYPTGEFGSFVTGGTADFPDELQRLKELLHNGLSEGICEGPDPLPFLPWLNSAQIFCAQPQIVEFDGGRGVRYLTYYAQGLDPLLDWMVFYTFQGISDDGELYISAVLPVQTGVFPMDPPADYPNCIDPANVAQCNQQVAEQLAQLNAQAGDAFNPALPVLDDMIRSLRIVKQ